MKKSYLVCLSLLASFYAMAQEDSLGGMNMDAVYERPFLYNAYDRISVGGYLETHLEYKGEEGVNEGYSFDARRFTVFMSGQIAPRISFFSELEYEHGTEEIAIEFAAIDLQIHPALNIRGGVIMNPIGAFNQNHDGPKWLFVERPEMAVNLLPATFSNPGFGVFGKWRFGKTVLGYEAYLSNGFDGSIIDNEEGKTFLPAVKENPGRMGGSGNGALFTSGKISLKNPVFGELGFSHLGGVYNRFEGDGLVLDEKRRMDAIALDYSKSFEKTSTLLRAEFTRIFIDIAENYDESYGENQSGFYLDLEQVILNPELRAWPDAKVMVGLRFDYVDWNRDEFPFGQGEIGDELYAGSFALAFRPVSQTVLRLNYRRQLNVDLLNNPPTRGGAWFLGLSTYF